MIAVEELTLDRPIASNCVANRDDVEALIGFGYFMETMNCVSHIDENGGFGIGEDTVCYHSNVQTAFYS